MIQHSLIAKRSPHKAIFPAVFIFLCITAFTAVPACAQNQNSSEFESDQTTAHTETGPIGKAFNYVTHNSYFRIGAEYFQYFGTSTNLSGEGRGAPILAATTGNPIADSGSSISNKLTLGATYGLFIPKTRHHLAIEFALAPPLTLEFQAKGEASRIGQKPPFSYITGGKAVGERIGTLKALPPSFTLVYRPWTKTVFRPYIGVGAMYLYTYDKKVKNTQIQELSNALGDGHPSLYLSKPVACVGQLGIDFDLPGNLFLTADARYVGCTSVRSTLNLGDNNKLTSNNHFHAVLYQLSLGIGF